MLVLYMNRPLPLKREKSIRKRYLPCLRNILGFCFWNYRRRMSCYCSELLFWFWSRLRRQIVCQPCQLTITYESSEMERGGNGDFHDYRRTPQASSNEGAFGTSRRKATEVISLASGSPPQATGSPTQATEVLFPVD
ncbi:hypothetical protein U1Q18_015627 [Sarracenia purpurea var. burkii]